MLSKTEKNGRIGGNADNALGKQMRLQDSLRF